MITFERVSKRYGDDHDALRELSFEIGGDELVFLTGHSGAGKSTLLRLIMLMERPTRGRIVVDGTDLARVSRRAIPRHRQSIGVVFQDHRLLFDRSVFDNVALPLLIAGYTDRDVQRRVSAALDKVESGAADATLHLLAAKACATEAAEARPQSRKRWVVSGWARPSARRRFMLPQ